jgi:hypothetical protein
MDKTTTDWITLQLDQEQALCVYTALLMLLSSDASGDRKNTASMLMKSIEVLLEDRRKKGA